MPGLIPLLRAVAADSDRLDPDLFDDAAVRWAIEVGLGPTLYRAVRNHPSCGRPREAFEWLQGSDLAGRVVVGEILDALEEILVSSDALAEQITLLKGASLSQFLYPEPHLRPMVDMDLLVTEPARTQLESALHQLGYRQQSSLPSEFYETHHHGMPFVHGARRLCVEVHTALLSRCAAARDRVFSSAHVSSRIEPAISRGHRTNRLGAELELVYTCTHWALERGCLAGGVLPLVDVVHQVTRRGGELDWDRLLSDLDDSHAATHVRLALGYLERQAVIRLPPRVSERLAEAQRCPLGPSEPILDRLLDRYAMQGRRFGRLASANNVRCVWDALLEPRSAWRNLAALPWKVGFPPGNPQRFSPTFQLGRLMGTIRRKGRD
jgi:hypothetical protein